MARNIYNLGATPFATIPGAFTDLSEFATGCQYTLRSRGGCVSASIQFAKEFADRADLPSSGDWIVIAESNVREFLGRCERRPATQTGEVVCDLVGPIDEVGHFYPAWNVNFLCFKVLTWVETTEGGGLIVDLNTVQSVIEDILDRYGPIQGVRVDDSKYSGDLTWTFTGKCFDGQLSFLEIIDDLITSAGSFRADGLFFWGIDEEGFLYVRTIAEALNDPFATFQAGVRADGTLTLTEVEHRDLLYNAIKVVGGFHNTQRTKYAQMTVRDEASIASNGLRTFQCFMPSIQDRDDMLSFSDGFLKQYANPTNRYDVNISGAGYYRPWIDGKIQVKDKAGTILGSFISHAVTVDIDHDGTRMSKFQLGSEDPARRYNTQIPQESQAGGMERWDPGTGTIGTIHTDPGGTVHTATFHTAVPTGSKLTSQTPSTSNTGTVHTDTFHTGTVHTDTVHTGTVVTGVTTHTDVTGGTIHTDVIGGTIHTDVILPCFTTYNDEFGTASTPLNPAVYRHFLLSGTQKWFSANTSANLKGFEDEDTSTIALVAQVSCSKNVRASAIIIEMPDPLNNAPQDLGYMLRSQSGVSVDNCYLLYYRRINDAVPTASLRIDKIVGGVRTNIGIKLGVSVTPFTVRAHAVLGVLAIELDYNGGANTSTLCVGDTTFEFGRNHGIYGAWATEASTDPMRLLDLTIQSPVTLPDGCGTIHTGATTHTGDTTQTAVTATACTNTVATAFDGTVLDPIQIAKWTQTRFISTGGNLFWKSDGSEAQFLRVTDGNEFETVAMFTEDICTNNHEVLVDVVSALGGVEGTARVGIVARASSADLTTGTGYIGYLERPSTGNPARVMRIAKFTNGVLTTLIARQTVTIDPDRLTFTVNGTTLTLEMTYTDGPSETDCITVTDGTHTTGQFVGLYGYLNNFTGGSGSSIGVHVDNYTAIAISTNPAVCCRTFAADNFNTADADPIGIWTLNADEESEDIKIVSNKAVLEAQLNSTNYSVLATWPEELCEDDMEAEFDSSSAGAGSFTRVAGLTVRQNVANAPIDDGTLDCYVGEGGRSTGLTILSKVESGTQSTMGTGTGASTSNTTYKTQAIGTTIKFFAGGVERISQTNSDVTVGKFTSMWLRLRGVGVTALDTISADDWTAESL